MNMTSKITVKTISSNIGRPVRLFTSVCSRSRAYDKGIMEESARIIEEHGGSAVVAIHPGFYLQDEHSEMLIAGMNSPCDKEYFGGVYKDFRSRFEKFLSSSRLPLLLFIEKDKGLAPYSWAIDLAKPPLTLVLEMTKPSFLPMIREDASDESLFWVWTASTICFDLGIRKARFTGEYLFINDGIRSGCVQSAYQALERHVAGDPDLELTFPNTPRREP